jgi:hypothetical protein
VPAAGRARTSRRSWPTPDAIPLATYTVLPCTGHPPQVETPEELLSTILHLRNG